ncbi:pentatricopeptide repeat-containing protein At4g21065-like [Primulina tabacum]|uniref:pentatricopeptide repeat-containing protein At4g21065-like n=1 Tax=Primulina tabacum TaxID=48773 RepID=UPI003F593471
MYKRATEQDCLTLLQLCNSLSKLSQLHSFFLKLGFQSNPLILTKFTTISSHLNVIDYASSLIFSPESEPHCYDSFLFNTVIKAYAETNSFKRTAICYYREMLFYGVGPNNYTYPFVLKACAGIADLDLGKTVHGCENGIDMAEMLFDEMSKCDSVPWSAMIGGYVRWGVPNEAVKLFRKMQIARVRPDEITMVMVLSACADLGALELGRWVESYIHQEKVEKSTELWNALIDMFAKCGDVDKALRLFRNMCASKRSIVSWTSVITGMGTHGRGLEAVTFFEEMKKAAGLVPDDVTFIGLLSACSHSGLVDKGKQYFDAMVNEFGITPRIEHYGCMVDLFSRVGLVKEAVEFVSKMPIDPNPVIWRTLIAASRANGELNLGERIAKELMSNQPVHESTYILLSNLYAKTMAWEKKSTIRRAMGKKGIRKVPGSAMIELAGVIYEFVAGDRTHKEHQKIYQMVDEMERRLKSGGYGATTSYVLLDIDDADKEGAPES